MSRVGINQLGRMAHALNPGPVPHHCALKKHYLNHQTWTSQLISRHRAQEQCTQLLSGTVKPLVYSVTGPKHKFRFFSLYFPVLSCALRKASFWVSWARRNIMVQIERHIKLHTLRKCPDFYSCQSCLISNKYGLKLYASKNKHVT